MKKLLENFLFCGIWSLVVVLTGWAATNFFASDPVGWCYLLCTWIICTVTGMITPEDDKIFKKRK